MVKGVRISLGLKLGILASALICVVILIMELINYTAAKELAANAATEKVKSDLSTGEALLNEWYPGAWRVEGDKLYKGNILINENFSIVDKLSKLTNDSVTIFLHDTRIATNVKNENGSRAVGTKVSDEVANVVLKGGHAFYGEADVVGKKSETAYKPIKDDNGNVIGIFFVGVSKEIMHNQINKTNTYSIMSGIALLVIACFILLAFIKKIVLAPIKTLMEEVHKYSEGDFSHKIDIKLTDEIGLLASSLNNMSEQLSALIKEVIEGSKAVAAHSEELAASSEEISATMEEVASTTTEVAATANANHENANIAVADAKNVEDVAKAGNDTVKQTVAKINSMAGSSKEVNTAIINLGELSNKIGNITTVINAIAEQTNLLALNAAIEAARAGESGKGFAVVAEEVRKLAEQSSNATDEITGLIKQVQTGVEKANNAMKGGTLEVEEGVRLAIESGQALDNINIATSKTIELIKEIAEGSEQTSGGMEQVAANSEEISSTIQEMTGSSQELAEISNRLQRSVDKFTV